MQTKSIFSNVFILTLLLVKEEVDSDEGTEIYKLRNMKKGIESEFFCQLILSDISRQNSLNMMLSCKSSDRLPYSVQDHKSL